MFQTLTDAVILIMLSNPTGHDLHHRFASEREWQHAFHHLHHHHHQHGWDQERWQRELWAWERQMQVEQRLHRVQANQQHNAQMHRLAEHHAVVAQRMPSYRIPLVGYHTVAHPAPAKVTGHHSPQRQR